MVNWFWLLAWSIVAYQSLCVLSCQILFMYKAWRQLHKNAASNIKQEPETTPNKAADVWPPTTHHENFPSETNQTCWRSRDELINDVLLWTPSHGRAKAERPARNYIQQLCDDTGCSPGDLPEAMNDREGWRERVRDIRADGTTWWWWYIFIYIYIYIYVCVCVCVCVCMCAWFVSE